MTAQAVSEASRGNIDCIVAGGGDGTINEVFGAAYAAGLPSDCCLGVLPLGTANDFAHSTGVPLHDLTAALQLAAPPRQGIKISSQCRSESTAETHQRAADAVGLWSTTP